MDVNIQILLLGVQKMKRDGRTQFIQAPPPRHFFTGRRCVRHVFVFIQLRILPSKYMHVFSLVLIMNINCSTKHH
jgi:hypothetical protein